MVQNYTNTPMRPIFFCQNVRFGGAIIVTLQMNSFY